MNVVLWIIAAFLAFGAVLTVASIGKPRKEMTSGTAAVVVLVDLILISLIFIYQGALLHG